MAVIDIIKPCAGSALYFEETLRSVLRQSFLDFRVLVIDNACNHRRYEEITRIFTDCRVEYIRHSTRLMMMETWNRCLQSVHSNVFGFIHDDDLWLENYLASGMECLRSGLDRFAACCFSSQMNNTPTVFEQIMAGIPYRGNEIMRFVPEIDKGLIL
jgi:glycosyltransferase involved in cell wall biosynthesis